MNIQQKVLGRLESLAEKGRISDRTLAALTGAVYFISLIPLLVIAACNFPAADDYSMDVETHQAVLAGKGLVGVFRAAVDIIREYYYTWQGTYTGLFLMVQSPAIYGEQYYRITTWVILGALTAGMLFFFHVLFCKCLKIRTPLIYAVCFILLFICVQCMPEGENRVQTFFWYNGSIYYTGLFAVGLVYTGILLLLLNEQRRRLFRLILASLLGLLLGGANYMTALTVMILSVLLLLYCLTGRKASKLLLLPPTLCLLAGLIISMAAPGNSVRSAGTNGYGPIKAILLSFYYVINSVVDDWMLFPSILLLLIMIPLFWKICGQTDYDFRYPGIAMVGAFGLAAANITAPLYGTGLIGAGRIGGLFWIQTMLLMTLTEFYFTGYLRQRLGRRSDPAGHIMLQGASFRIMALLTVFWLLGSVLCLAANPDYYTGASAAEDLRNGNAAQYAAEQQARFEILHDESVTDAVLTEFSVKPDLLFYTDITEDPADWTNSAAAEYYGKNSVVLKRR